MSIHRAFVPDLSMFSPGAAVVLEGDDAHHLARVKRVEPGAEVLLLDGRGRVATSRVAATRKTGRDGWFVDVTLGPVELVQPVRPRLDVWACAPKGDRLGAMIDGLSQVGAASWAPLVTARTVVEPGAHKLDRVHRIAVESSKQCGRAWMLEIEEGGDVEAALATDAMVVMADGSGEAYQPAGERVRLLVGPEGGWNDGELARARAAGARVCRFGPHVMRVEVAAAAAAARILAAHGV